MSEYVRKLGPKVWVISAIAVWLAVFGSIGANASSSGDEAVVTGEKSALALNFAQNQVPAGATYVGEDTCLGCHEAVAEKFSITAHHEAADPRTPAAKQGCESCHGPGSLHIEDPVSVKPLNFKTMPADQASAICTTCHSRGEHALWDGSQHDSRGVTCTTCHSVHNPMSESKQLKKATQAEVCASCHRDKVSKIDRAGHMPVREGKLACSSCHNVHGTTNVKLLRKGDSVADSCTSCHADKRGPFLWEHAPSRDGCTTCHDPHGSANDRMLVAKLPQLCQRCHSHSRHPATPYDGSRISSSSRQYARACVLCHSNIHGSNHPAGSFFMR